MNNNYPLVSVIMCVYNTPQHFLIEAVNSILNQTYNNLELIIVDDHSSDNLFTDKVFENKKIRIIHNSENHGPSYSRNRALDVSKGKYIAIMDSDDISLPTRIEKQVKYMEENSNVVACGTWFKFIGSKSEEVKRVIDDNEYYRCCLFFGNAPTLLNSSVIIRKETLDKNNIRYDEQLKYSEDYKMWCQLARIGVITNYKEVLVYYRVHEKQMTQDDSFLEHKKRYIVRKELLNELEVSLSAEEEQIFLDYFSSRKYSANRYAQLLEKIVAANKLVKKYDQDKFELRVYEQWKMMVLEIKNPFKFLSFLIKQKKQRKEILKIKTRQLLRKY